MAEVRKSGWDRRRGEAELAIGVEIGAAMREICPGICPGTARLTRCHAVPLADWVEDLLPPPTPPTHHGCPTGVGTGSKVGEWHGFAGSGETGEELAERLASSEGR